jgi:hypothetical protein
MNPPSRPTLDDFARGDIDDADLAVLERMAHMYETLDPVPAGLVDRVTFGITLDALHAEIAELQRSSDLVGVRGEGDDTTSVTFTSSTLTTMVTITTTSTDSARIDGWVVPSSRIAVELRTHGQTYSTRADEDGRFAFDDVPRGLVQFVLRLPDPAAPVITPSLEI